MVLTQEHIWKASAEAEEIWDTRTRRLEEEDKIFALTVFPARQWGMKKTQIFGTLDVRTEYVKPAL